MNRILLLLLVFFVLFSNYMIVGANAQECGVDVYDLTVQDSEISANIKNAGNETGIIAYDIYVNNDIVFSSNVTIGHGETIYVKADYSFDYGEYAILLVASSGCGYQDYETIAHLILEDYSCSSPPGFQGQELCDSLSQKYFVCDKGEWVETQGYIYKCSTPDETIDNYCREGYLNNYRCSGNSIQREYQLTDCSTGWTNIQYCQYGCENNQCQPRFSCSSHYYKECYNDDVWWYDSCNRRENVYDYCESGCSNSKCAQDYCYSGWTCTDSYYKAYRYSDCSLSSRTYCQYGCDNGRCMSETSCGVDITALDYMEYVVKGYQSYVTATVLNTGDREETIDLILYIDNARKGYYSKTLDPDESYIKTFYYYPGSGTQQIKMTANTDCGSTDTRLATTYTQKTSYAQPVCNNNGVCESARGENENNCWNDCEPAEPIKTYVSFYPESLDIVLYKGNPLVISIKTSKPQGFAIDISGIPHEWTSYSKQIDVDIEGTAYVYIIPREPGTYDMTVSVTALSEGLEFSSDVDLYVAPEKKKIESSFGGAQINGIIENALGDFWVMLLIVIIAAVLVISAGVIRLTEKHISTRP